MSRPPAIAIVGLGRMGRFHAETLAPSTAVTVDALADVSAPALTNSADWHPEAAQYTDVTAALDHPGLAGVLVATPTPTHAEVVAAAIDRGLHVLCEKPLSLNSAESRELGAAAAAAGVVLQVGFWRRFSPPWARAKELLDDGAIGEPVLIRLSQWDADPPPPAFCDPAVSGGLAVDCGVHEFDLAEWFTGSKIVTMQSHVLRAVDPTVAEVGDVDNLLVTARLADGTTAVVDLSRTARYGDDVRTEILGSKGALFVDLLPTGRTRLATVTGVSVVPGSEVDDATAAGLLGQIEAFAAAIAGSRRDVPGAEASAAATEAGIQAMRSITPT